VNAHWQVLQRLGEVRVWAFDSRPVPAERRELAKLGVVALAGRHEKRVPLLWRHMWSFASGRSMLYAKAYSPHRVARLAASLREWRPDLLIIGDTWLADLLPDLRGLARRTAVDTHNVESELYRRMAAEQPWPGRMKVELFRRNAERLERHLAAADLVCAVSDADAAFYRNRQGLAQVAVLPNAIDTAAYKPGGVIPDPHTLVFTGTFGYWPNQSAAMHLIELSRRLKERGIEHRTALVGRDPSEAMRAAAAGLEWVTITGPVPDIREHVLRATLLVAPLTSGSGTKYKILEALALGRPVVTTSVGAEGLDLVDGVHAAVASDLDQLPDRVAALLRDPERRARMGEAGRRWVVETHSLEALEAGFRTALVRLGLGQRDGVGDTCARSPI
jgi:glycosyltransferase involved in cell wall biosynthesis